jgi:hypothetical protein
MRPTTLSSVSTTYMESRLWRPLLAPARKNNRNAAARFRLQASDATGAEFGAVATK